jgi:hypothetical protein
MGKRLRSYVGLVLAAGLVHVFHGTSMAEIPNLSSEQLQKNADVIVTGKVAAIYTRPESQGDYEYSHRIAEIVVDEVRQGQDMRAGDRLYVRYWSKRFVGEGNPETGHFGHRGVPAEGERAVAHLKGNRNDGYDVLSPNGLTGIKPTNAQGPSSRD